MDAVRDSLVWLRRNHIALREQPTYCAESAKRAHHKARPELTCGKNA